MHDPKATAALLKNETSLRPALALVLGSGFQHALRHFKPALERPYGQLPGFPTVGVTGHAGKLVFGHFGAVPVVVLKGRAHYYEGHDMERITFPIRVLAELGVREILFTNAAGAVNRSFKPGDFMLVEDHINLMGVNPLRGQQQSGLSRFLDLSCVYDARLRKLTQKAARSAKLRWHSGIYMAVSGPTYETPAEISAFRRLGADAIGMSTVPEAIVARHCGLLVAAVSCITNIAGGGGRSGPLAHRDVLATGEKQKDAIARFLNFFVQSCAER